MSPCPLLLCRIRALSAISSKEIAYSEPMRELSLQRCITCQSITSLNVTSHSLRQLYLYPSSTSLEDLVIIQWKYVAEMRTLYINDQSVILEPVTAEGDSPRQVSSSRPFLWMGTSGIVFPWMNEADVALIGYNLDSQSVPVQLTVSEDRSSPPLIQYRIDASEALSRDHPLLTITFNGTAVPTFLLPASPYSYSPSWTYPIRHAAISVIAPIALVAVFAVPAGWIGMQLIFVWCLGSYMLGVACGSLKSKIGDVKRTSKDLMKPIFSRGLSSGVWVAFWGYLIFVGQPFLYSLLRNKTLAEASLCNRCMSHVCDSPGTRILGRIADSRTSEWKDCNQSVSVSPTRLSPTLTIQ